MIHSDKGQVRVSGTARDIFFDLSAIIAALGDEFSQDAVIHIVALALATLSGKAERTDLTQLDEVLKHLRDHPEE